MQVGNIFLYYPEEIKLNWEANMKKLLLTTSAMAFAFGTFAQAATLKLGHNLAEEHPTSMALSLFADTVKEKSDGKLKIKLYFNGVLGSEREVLEQVQNGAVDMTRVGAASLESFSPVYSAFSLPYLFNDKEHFYKVMNSDVGQKIYDSAAAQGFQGLTYFDGGARSFYTKSKLINEPADLKGQKIRVMNSQTAIRMIELLGGTPTPMPYGELYTALQQGVIDGAENNPTALTLGRHGEVAKFYSLDEHSRIPDFLIISTKTWKKLSEEEQKILKEAAYEATIYHIEIWNKEVEKALSEAKNEMGVTIITPEKKPFRDAVSPLYEEYMKDSTIADIVNAIRKIN